MEQVFAPWRIEWVTRERHPEEGCVFCTIPKGTEDREALLLARSEHAYVLLNNYPYNPGHALVIPYNHTGDYTDLSAEVLLDHAQLKQRTLEALEEAMDPEGFNAGLNLGSAAGGSIGDHVHTHVVPRWEGDTNFMPIIDDTTVIVEALDATYDRVRAAFADQDGVSDPGEDSAVEIEEPTGSARA